MAEKNIRMMNYTASITAHKRLLALSVFAIAALPAKADIYQWEYINPTDPSQGKRQSATLCPDGAGVDAVPEAILDERDLTMAYLSRMDLNRASLYGARLTNADLTQANLSNAALDDSDLDNADFSRADLSYASLNYGSLAGAVFAGATVRGASFMSVTTQGFSAAQLYSTASYVSHELSGINLGENDLSNWSFTGQNLTSASFYGATLTGANFAQANLTAASLGHAVLTNANLNQANLTDAYVGYARLGSSGITVDQLYTTSSYKTRNLQSLVLASNDLSYGNFVGQNMANSDLSMATLANADFSEANLNGANLSGANLPGANLSGANLVNTVLTATNLTNAIVRGTDFHKGIASATGISAHQLSTTASYQAHDLTGIGLNGNDLRGGSFAGQNLTAASLRGANLTAVEFANAVITGVNFSSTNSFSAAQLYSTASYQVQVLTGIDLSGNFLGNWNFSGQNLANANFAVATLVGANFTDANVRGANFNSSRAFASTQLYSTQSYQNHDLTGINLHGLDLTGWDFSGQNLSNADLKATLTGADFNDAIVSGAYLVGISPSQLYTTASYKGRDLKGISLFWSNVSGWNFEDQSLVDADFQFGTLTNANFSGSNIRGANFGRSFFASGTGLSLTQLYSTASYQTLDLVGVSLRENDLTGANFVDQNLTNSDLYEAKITGANFDRADARGSSLIFSFLNEPASSKNMIRSNGQVFGLDLASGETLLIRDYDADSTRVRLIPQPTRIQVRDQLMMSSGSVLRMLLEEDNWDSTIAFQPDIPATLGGSLELLFVPGVDVATQLGRRIRIFDWTGVMPVGQFNVVSPYSWDLSRLYSTGEVTLVAIPEPPCFLLAAIGLPVLWRLSSRKSNRRTLLYAGIRTAVITFLVVAGGVNEIQAGEVYDDFSVSHDYSGGNVAGTIWGGVLNSNDLALGNANIQNAGRLTWSAIPYSGWEWETFNNAPTLYRLVSGDFDVSVRVADMTSAIFSDGGLIARVPDVNAAGNGEDYVALRYFAAYSFNSSRSTDNGVTSNKDYFTDDGYVFEPYLRLRRDGNSFDFYTRPDPSSDWIHRDSFSRPDIGEIMQVGPWFGTFSENSGTAQFDDFVLSAPSISEPANLTLTIFGALVIIGHRRRRTWMYRASSLRRRLQVETLEDRRLLSITVDTLVDENDGMGVGGISLRDAITAAVANETIDFLPALTSSGPATILLTNGVLPTINKNLSIVGPGSGLLTIDASGNDPTPEVDNGDGSRIFTITDSNAANLLDVSISGLTLTGGDRAFGGAIQNVENLTVSSCALIGNSSSNSTSSGGAISSSGSGAALTIVNSTISGNIVGPLGRGGGLSFSGGTLNIIGSTFANNSAGSSAGALSLTGGSVTITDCLIDGNSSGSFGTGGANGGGGAIYAQNLTAATLTNVTISSNTSTGNAGGIRVASGAAWTLINSTIDNNQAALAGGGLLGSTFNINGGRISNNKALNGSGGGIGAATVTINGTSVHHNSASGSGGGVDASTVTVYGASIHHNTAGGNGGGIRSSLELTVGRSEFFENVATVDGGGIFAPDVFTVATATFGNNSAGRHGGAIRLSGQNAGSTQSLTDSAVYGNSAGGGGGGISVSLGNLTIGNSTISGNSALVSGGGLTAAASGARIDARFTTITGNSAPADAGSGVYRGGGEMIFYSSIIAGNVLSDADANSISGAAFRSTGYNLVGTGSAVAAFNQPGDQTGVADPMLGMLADNGGPTMTHAILPGSPAIDAGDPSAVAGMGAVPANDQRGMPFGRVFDGDNSNGPRIDIGAVELQPLPPAFYGDYNDDHSVDAADYVVWRKTLGTTVSNYSGADGDGDGSVEGDDHDVWRAHFGEMLPIGSGAARARGAATPAADATDEALGQTYASSPRLNAIGERQYSDEYEQALPSKQTNASSLLTLPLQSPTGFSKPQTTVGFHKRPSIIQRNSTNVSRPPLALLWSFSRDRLLDESAGVRSILARRHSDESSSESELLDDIWAEIGGTASFSEGFSLFMPTA
jgi:uncharacterized protein YjbI with pentapeptide repeats